MANQSSVSRVGILGATGLVGRALIDQIQSDASMKIEWLGASDRHQGKRLEEAVPEDARSVQWGSLPPLEKLDPVPDRALGLDFVFSALPKEIADQVEPEWARRTIVISNASAFREDPMVPLVIPEVNGSHIVPLLRRQRAERGWRGLVTNPNCATIPLVMAVAPWRDLGLRSLCVTTFQALSGAGRDGPRAFDVLGNLLPDIPGEAPKIESEPLKILGTPDRLESSIKISAATARVPVIHGHLVHVRVRFEKPAMTQGLLARWKEATSLERVHGCDVPLKVLERAPEPRDLSPDDLTVYVGGLEPDPLFHVRFWALAHNLTRGAAGAAWLNANAVRSRLRELES